MFLCCCFPLGWFVICKSTLDVRFVGGMGGYLSMESRARQNRVTHSAFISPSRCRNRSLGSSLPSSLGVMFSFPLPSSIETNVASMICTTSVAEKVPLYPHPLSKTFPCTNSNPTPVSTFSNLSGSDFFNSRGVCVHNCFAYSLLIPIFASKLSSLLRPLAVYNRNRVHR